MEELVKALTRIGDELAGLNRRLDRLEELEQDEDGIRRSLSKLAVLGECTETVLYGKDRYLNCRKVD